MEALDKPQLVIFSSTNLIPIAEAVRENLKREFEVTPWTEGLFPPNEIALNAFLKQLLRFDAAVVVLGPDDLQVDRSDPGRTRYVPRDNVIFELGACMSRMGTKKTFIICPEQPEVTLPSYFWGMSPLKYEQRSDGNLISAVGSACAMIRTSFQRLQKSAYYSDLPAGGLSHGYFDNFVRPTYERLRSGMGLDLGVPWKREDGFTIAVVMPDEFMTRDQVNDEFEELGLEKAVFELSSGRSIGAYVRPRSEPGAPLHVYDIPTTLLTSEKVIQRIDSFFGGGGDMVYQGWLKKREIINFRRSIEARIEEAHMKRHVRTITLPELVREVSGGG